MATGGAEPAANPQQPSQPSHRGAPAPPAPGSAATSPPSKRELASWWKKFRKTTEKSDEKVDAAPGIFGVPLAESIRYANVAISLTNDEGESFIYGYVPIVVAKCGVFLKEKATDVEGIFRLSGSAKRIKDLQVIFNSPEKYGKGLDWTGYTVHDAANILRRYLNQLPEPIVPLDFYERFREPLRPYQTRATNDGEAQPIDMNLAEHSAAVAAYQALIKDLPPLNTQLLLYILDLLAVFASKSELNRMTAANLAAIFQPGIISHPSHDMAPMEYRLSQEVLIFLIESQDNFIIGMNGTAVDEKTQKDVESGALAVRSPKVNIGRSASNASGGADSLRKFGVRRNVSVSSHNSRERSSPGVSSPGTPSGGGQYSGGSGGSGIARSNTVPSKRSPALASNRFQRMTDTPASPASYTQHSGSSTPIRSMDGAGSKPSTANSNEPDVVAAPESTPQAPIPQTRPLPQEERNTSAPVPPKQGAAQPVTRERKISNLFSKSPGFGPSEVQQRQPRKLQKRQRIPGSANESAQSSQASLHDDVYHTPLVSPDGGYRPDPMIAAGRLAALSVSSGANETPVQHNSNVLSLPTERSSHASGLQPPRSPTQSLHSRSSVTDHSEFEALEEVGGRPEKAEQKKSRWRFSSSAKKPEDFNLAPPPPIGQIAGARGSASSIGSSGRARKSFTADSQLTQHDASSMNHSGLIGHSSQESADPSREANIESEKKGLFGKWKAKMSASREERKEREAEKERAKSPPRAGSEHNASHGSLTAYTQEHFSARGRSLDKPRGSTAGLQEEGLATVAERPNSEIIAQGQTPQPPQSQKLPQVPQAPQPQTQPQQQGVPTSVPPPSQTQRPEHYQHVVRPLSSGGPVAATEPQGPRSAGVSPKTSAERHRPEETANA